MGNTPQGSGSGSQASPQRTGMADRIKVDTTGEKIALEFRVDDLLTTINRNPINELTSHCGGCYGCSGCSH